MLFSLALIFTICLVLSELFMKIKLPGFIGMILTGIILGPFVFDLIDGSILNISDELREIALIVILLRAGLSLDIKDLKIIGRPAILMAFIPATLEIVAVAIFAPILFGITLVEALVLGSVLAAVSPAVIVPKMIALMEQKYGEKKRIPHLIMAGASVDDIYVIVLFTIFTRMYLTGGFAVSSLFEIPIAIVLGVLVGLLVGVFLAKLFSVFRVRDTIKVLMMLSAAFFVIALEDTISSYIPFSGLLAVMVIGIPFLNQSEVRAKRVQQKFSKIWVFAEVVLFVLVGAKVDISVALTAGLVAILLLIIELIFTKLIRM